MFGFLRILRGIIGVIFALQIIGMLPALSWVQNPEAIGAHHLVMLAFKLLATAAFGAAFFGLRAFINWLHQKMRGTPHPALAVKRFAL